MSFDYEKRLVDSNIATTVTGITTTAVTGTGDFDCQIFVPFATNTLLVNCNNDNRKHKAFIMPSVTKVMHTKQGSTVVFFDDGTKTWVNPAEGTEPDPFVGFCMAVMKRLYGSTSNMIRDYENHLTGGGADGGKKGKHER